MKKGYVFKPWLIFLATCFLLWPFAVSADDFADFGTTAGQRLDINLPTITGGYFVALDFFPDGSTDFIGMYEAEGRAIVASNTTIYINNNYGSDVWVPVATVTNAMDPCFVHVSPNGSQIALGLGYGQDILVFDTDILDPDNPPNLDTHAGVTNYDVDHYEAEWLDEQYLLVNGTDTWPLDDEQNGVSGLAVLDTTDPNATGQVLITDITGSSAAIAVDADGNVLTGIGWSMYGETGQIKLWKSADINAAISGGTSFDYATTGLTVADNVLSAAAMGLDAEDNLHVGGGDYVDATENGYGALIHHSVMDDLVSGARTTPVDDGASSTEYKEIAPDTCQDDSATFASSSSWGNGLIFVWNPSGDESNGGACYSAGSGSDYWLTGVTPVMSIYTSSSATDTDSDGVPDIQDDAYKTYQESWQFGVDTDGDGWANIADADLDNDGVVGPSDYTEFKNRWNTSDPDADFDSSGTVNANDYSIFRNRWYTSGPYY